METKTIRQRGLAPLAAGTVLLGCAALLWLMASPAIGGLVGVLALLFLLGRLAFRLEGKSEVGVWWTLARVPLWRFGATEPAKVREVVLTLATRRGSGGGVKRIHTVQLEVAGADRVDLWDEGSYTASKRLAEEVARVLHRPFRDEVAAAIAAGVGANRPPSRFAWLGLLAVGLVFLGIAAWLGGETRRFVMRAERTSGTVIELRQTGGPKGPMYAPVVRWRGPGGEDRTFTSRQSSRPPAFDVGEAVTVLHDPRDPGSARIEDFRQLWLTSAIAGGSSVVMLVLALWAGLARRVR